MKPFPFVIFLLVVLLLIGCGKYYYAKDLKEKNIVEFRWLKEMEEYVFHKKNDAERTEKERIFYRSCYFDAQMQRGGFALFFQNSASGAGNAENLEETVRDTISALKKMDMHDRADVLAETYARYREMKAVRNGSDEHAIKAMLENNSRRYHRLSAGDIYYLEGLINKARAFVEKNIDEFYYERSNGLIQSTPRLHQ